MKATGIVFIVLLWLTGVQAQNKIVLLPVEVDGHWGYINSGGEIIIKPQFDFAGDFNGRFAVIKKDGYFGLVDSAGKIAVNPVYDAVTITSQYVFCVKRDSMWGLVGPNGKMLLEPMFPSIVKYNSCFFMIEQNGKQGVADTLGRIIVPANYDNVTIASDRLIIVDSNKKSGAFTASGIHLLNATYDFIMPDKDDFVFYQLNKLWGCISLRGKNLFETAWPYYKVVNKNFIAVSNGYDSIMSIYSVPAHAFICGKKYDDVLTYSNQRIIVRKNNGYGIMDSTGQLIVSTQYSAINYLTDSLYEVNLEGSWGIADYNGKLMVPIKYDYISKFTNKAAVVSINSKYGLINMRGQVLKEPVNQDITVSSFGVKIVTDAPDHVEMLTLDSRGNIDEDTRYNNFRTLQVDQLSSRYVPAKTVNTDSLPANDVEWFYSASAGKWGLRYIKDGSIVIEPSFCSIQQIKQTSFTDVAIIGTRKDNIESGFALPVKQYLHGMYNDKQHRFILKPQYLSIDDSELTADPNLQRVRCMSFYGVPGLVSLDGSEQFTGFSFIGPFSNGLARICTGGKIQFVETKDNEILGVAPRHLIRTNYWAYIPPDASTNHYNTTYIKYVNGQWGYVNASGQISIRAGYSYARDFDNGTAIVKRAGKWGAIDTDGHVVIPAAYDQVSYLDGSDDTVLVVKMNSDNYGYVNNNGAVVVSAKYDKGRNFNNGYAAVKKNHKWGYTNARDSLIINTTYSQAGDFGDGKAPVSRRGKWGYIDTTGDTVIDFKFQKAATFHDGFAWAMLKNKYGLINEEGKFVISPRFSGACYNQNGLSVVNKGSRKGIIGNDGKWVLRPGRWNIRQFNNDGIAVALEGKSSVIVSSGQKKCIARVNYNLWYGFSEGVSAFSVHNKYGFMDTLGHVVISPRYESAANFSDGRARVHMRGKTYYIAHDTDIQAGPFAGSCSDFSDGTAKVNINGSEEFIDINGNMLFNANSGNTISKFKNGFALVNHTAYMDLPGKDPFGKTFQKATLFNNGIAVVRKDNKWGIIDQMGNNLSGYDFKEIGPFSNGIARMLFDHYEGAITRSGRVLVDATYRHIASEGSGLLKVESDDKVGYIRLNGEWLWAMGK